MTTIVADFRAGLMASDSKCNCGSMWLPATKIYRIEGELIGIAGNCLDEQRWLKWHREGRKRPMPKLEQFEALMLREDGLYVADATGLEMLIERGYHATGSGAPAALALMIAGHDARFAVEIAMQVDTQSGGEIQIARLKEPEPKKRRRP